MPSIKYQIAIPNPLKHQFKISIDISPVANEALTISLPNWIPGSYMIRDFAKHVVALEAHDKDSKLDVNALSKNRFEVKHNNQPFTVTYLYYAFDLSVRKAYLDQEFGFFNPAAALFCVDQQVEHECEVELIKPESELCQNWLPASGLDGINHDDCFAWSNYKANNYIHLTDFPIMFGQLDIESFDVAGVPHYLVTAGKHFGSLQRAAKDLAPLCQYHIDTFGELPSDVNKYLFLTMVTDKGFGGLEHLNSTALVCSRFDIAPDKEPSPLTNDDYITFLSLCSHEYLHTWNVKRLKPREFIPYSLESEVYTKQLWFYEGMTSYFDDLSLVKTNTISYEKYLEIFAKTLTRIEKGKGQLRQSVTESSMHTWTKFYQQDEAAPDQITSYYQKGAAIACLTDLMIKQNTEHKFNLTAAMKQAWQKFGRNNKGTTQDDLENLFKQFLSEPQFELFKHALYGSTKIDLTDALANCGVALKYVTQDNQKHVQGANTTAISKPWLGTLLAVENESIVVKQVLEDSPAEQAGIAKGDEIIAINNMKVNMANVEQLISVCEQSDACIHYFRKDTLYRSSLPKQPSPEFVAQLVIQDPLLIKTWLSDQ
ncbi:MAG: M61 family metallopeptidase [Gammaproteobacteria bacterium]|nr:M61 family metallopeptidase [Gammaproteobacteria bacterium]